MVTPGRRLGPAHDRVSRKPRPLTCRGQIRHTDGHGEMRKLVRHGKVRFALFYLLSIWSWLWDGAPLCQGRTWPNRTSSP